MTKTTSHKRKRAAKKSVKKKRGVEKSDQQAIQPGKDSVPPIVGPLPDLEWKSLRKKLSTAAARSPAKNVFPAETLGAKPNSGAIYLYGLAVAQGATPLAWHEVLAKLSTMTDFGKVSAGDRSLLCDEASQWLASVSASRGEPLLPIEAILWATNMATLTEVLPQETWWQLLAQLQQTRADSALEDDRTTARYLMLAGELGITLAWRLRGLPSCQRIGQSSLDAVAAFIDREGDSIDEVLKQPHVLRAVAASLVRCERLLPAISKRKFRKRHREIAGEFATWIAALMRTDGSQVFSNVAAVDVEADIRSSAKGKVSNNASPAKSKSKDKSNSSVELLSGLTKAACHFDAETLVPAMAASLGQSHSGGRLAWEVCLPEAMWHSDLGKVVAMLPEWDVRRGRSFLNYSGEDIQVEITGGRSIVFQGHHQTMVSVDGATMEPKGPWEYTCEYSDDDVHMIEFEQPHSGGVVLQRQWMVVRDDRCVMVSDAVIPDRNSTSPPESMTESPEITCVSRLPLADGIEVIQDEETRELVLTHGNKKRCMALPLAANEWRVGPSDCQVSVSEDRHLVVTTRGRGTVYSPIWLDFQTRRFRRPRTWRPLTVAEGLSMIPRSTAAAFRVQFGSEHWVLYRSLSYPSVSADSQSTPHEPIIRTPRSFMGKHLIADFFAARFHPGDGGMEELVTVDDANDNTSDDANED